MLVCHYLSVCHELWRFTMVSPFRVWRLLLWVCCFAIVTRGVEHLAAEPGLQTNKSPLVLPSVPDLSIRERNDMLNAFESTLLNMFGFSERPRPKGKKRVPEYIMDIYRRHSSGTTMDFDIEGKTTRTANTVKSFHHIEDHSYNEEPVHRHRLVFNLSSMENAEILTAAELRLFRHAIPEHKIRKRHALNESERITENTVRQRINLYQILKPVARNRDVIKRLIDSIVIDVRNSTWESLDVGPAVKSWKHDHNSNYGVEVEVIDQRGEPSLHGNDHLRTKRKIGDDQSLEMNDEDQWFQKRPLLVTYTDDGRTKRSTKKRTKRQKKKRRLKDNCAKHSLYVDFAIVGWDDWIMAPEGYQAFYCQGECPFPMPVHLNATNHAIVQTIIHSADSSVVPKACCVPTELNSLNMLYLNDKDQIILKSYKDMVVNSCGCR